MALDATVGGVNSNSYATVDEADSYFSNRIHADGWNVSLEGDTASKETFLISTAAMLEWYCTWKGYKTTTTQAMAWPRSEVYLNDGSLVDSSIIPKEIKIAVFELILESLEEDRTTDNELAGLSEVKAGPLFLKASSGFPDTTPKALPDKISLIVRNYLQPLNSVKVVRLMRG